MSTDEEAHKQNVRRGAALAGAAALAAAAAGYYYFYGSKNAKQHRRAVAKWTLGFKDEVMLQMEKLQELDREAIMGAIDRAMAAYRSVRDVDPAELKHAAMELKDHWQELATEFATGHRKTTKRKKTSSKKKRSKKAARE